MDKELTWEEIKAKERGAILHDEFDEGIRFIIMRGPSNLCAYVGIPEKHPLAGFDYDLLPIDCHGGLTYGNAGEKDDFRPEGYFWYGWDYGHCDDYSFYYDDLGFSSSLKREAKKWLVKDVKDDSWSAIYEFKRLMKLAEQIYMNGKIGK